jgi:hypothetical protein
MTGAALPAAGRRTFVHEATVALPPEGDDRAPGGAITLALCGSWSHEPPCPLAPHHTAAERSGSEVALRVLFAADPADESRVRRLVDEALSAGSAAGPDGVRTSWQLVASGPGDVRPEEQEHGRRLAGG